MWLAVRKSLGLGSGPSSVLVWRSLSGHHASPGACVRWGGTSSSRGAVQVGLVSTGPRACWASHIHPFLAGSCAGRRTSFQVRGLSAPSPSISRPPSLTLLSPSGFVGGLESPRIDLTLDQATPTLCCPARHVVDCYTEHQPHVTEMDRVLVPALLFISCADVGALLALSESRCPYLCIGHDGTYRPPPKVVNEGCSCLNSCPSSHLLRHGQPGREAERCSRVLESRQGRPRKVE